MDVEETEVPTKDAVLMVKPNIVAVFGCALFYAQYDFLATRTYFISAAGSKKPENGPKLTSKRDTFLRIRRTNDGEQQQQQQREQQRSAARPIERVSSQPLLLLFE